MDLVQIILFCIFNGVLANDPLDSVLLQDIIPSIGSKCKTNSDIYSFQTSAHTFDHYTSPSLWDSTASTYEQELFLAEMSNVNSANQNKSWTIRIGQSGNMYSFRGEYGEAMPPQALAGAYWVDEVTQSVSVNMEKNDVASGRAYYIHQAGVYMRDGEYTNDNPFFSPNIAKHCNEKECLFGSWGQQAHLPTQHKSNMLYFSGYRDCGDGIIEFTSVFHNANADLDNGDHVDYLNVPWAGVRTSTLRDALISNADGKMEVQRPIISWAQQGTIVEHRNTGGFTTFAQELLIPEDEYNANPFVMPSQNGVTLQLVIAANNRAAKSNHHSNLYNMYCMRVSVIATFTEVSNCNCNLYLINGRTNERVLTRLVLHWSWAGNTFYFCTDGEIQSSHFNEIFKGGDEIIVTYANEGKPIEDNLALSFVHGLENEVDENYRQNRMRVGSASNIARDYTVYTTNSFVRINPGDTYVYQQYIATGELSQMEAIGAEWKGEVYADYFSLSDMAGTIIDLYSNDANSFGAFVEGGNECLQGMSRCSGKTVPEFGLNALFAITCGTDRYVGSDKYHFSPTRASETDTIRSYACEGYNPDVRPEWKLLGFFEEGSCDFLQSASYDSSFCSTSVSPTPNPSLGPSSEPSVSPFEKPSLKPSSIPSIFPSQEPSLKSSSNPSMIPTQHPSLEPSSQPSLNPSIEPTKIPTVAPTNYPFLNPPPSKVPTPSHLPTPPPNEKDWMIYDANIVLQSDIIFVSHKINSGPRDSEVILLQHDCESELQQDEIVTLLSPPVTNIAENVTYGLFLDGSKAGTSEIVSFNDMWNASGNILFCSKLVTKTESGLEIAAKKNRFNISFDLSNLEFSIEDFALQEEEADNATLNLEFEVTACECDAQYRCISKVYILSDSVPVFRVCVTPSTNSMKITNLELTMTNDYGYEYKPVDTGTNGPILNSISSLSMFESTTMLTTRLVAGLFGPDIASLTGYGMVILGPDARKAANFYPIELSIEVQGSQISTGVNSQDCMTSLFAKIQKMFV